MLLTQDWSEAVPNRPIRWIYFTGNRFVLAIISSIVVMGVMAILVSAGIFAVGPNSTFPSILYSGVLTGMLTLLTVVLSINQLILSRLFGTAGGLWDDLEGSLRFREVVEDIAAVDASPNEPASFLRLLGETLKTRLEPLATIDDNRSISDPEVIESYVADVTDYADELVRADDLDHPMKVLILTLGSDNADHIDSTRALQRRFGESVQPEVAESLADALALLKSTATMRQFYKTLVLQQDLAQLSRDILYTGVPAILLSFFIPQLYSASPDVPPGINPEFLPFIAVLGTGLILLPFLLLGAYVLRIATVSLYSVSVGTFLPPKKSISDE